MIKDSLLVSYWICESISVKCTLLVWFCFLKNIIIVLKGHRQPCYNVLRLWIQHMIHMYQGHHSFYNAHVSHNLFSTSLLDLEEYDKLDWSFQRALCWVMGFLGYWSTFCGCLQLNLHVFIFCMGLTKLCIFTLLLHIYCEWFPTALSSLCIQRSQKIVVSAGWCLQAILSCGLLDWCNSIYGLFMTFFHGCMQAFCSTKFVINWVFNLS